MSVQEEKKPNFCGCRYAGLSVSSASFNLSNGIAPSVASLDIVLPLGASIPFTGDLVFFWDDKTISFFDCRTMAGGGGITTTNRTVNVQVRDWRWNWADYGELSGEYNRRDESGSYVDKANLKSLRELMKLCLEALGMTSGSYSATNMALNTFSVSGVSDTDYPYVNWEITRASDALSDLCERYGYIIYPGANNTIVIRLPEKFDMYDGKENGINKTIGADVAAYSFNVTLQDVPEKFKLVGKRAKHYMEIELEAVFYDPGANESDNGKWKPIGGTGEDAPSFFTTDTQWTEGIEKDLRDQNKIRQADAVRKTAFRCYRPKENTYVLNWKEPTERGTFSKTIKREELVRRWTNELPGYEEHFGEQARRSAYVFGEHWTKEIADAPIEERPEATESDNDNIVKIPFSLKTPPGVVWFSQPVFSVNESTGIRESAPITLACLVDGDTSIYESVFENVENPIIGKTRIIRRDDFVIVYDRLGTPQSSTDYLLNDPHMGTIGATHVAREKQKIVGNGLEETYAFNGFYEAPRDGTTTGVQYSCGTEAIPTTLINRGGKGFTRNKKELDIVVYAAKQKLNAIKSDYADLPDDRLSEGVE